MTYYASIKYSGLGTKPYTNIADLPLTGNATGAQAFVSENNRLYIWSGTGWYNIALVNTSPTAITGASGSYTFATDGTPIEITLVSTDPEGIPITWSYAVTSGSLTNNGGTTATVSQAANVFTITPSTNEDYVGEFSLTFTASDGVNLATATSSFSLMFAILNSRYTTLMLKAESSGSNTTFVDSSTNNFTITRNGDVTQGTFSPYSRPEGEWSNYFDGSGDYLQIPYSTSTTQWWLQDFTIEMWVYNNTNSVSGSDGLCLQLTHGVATIPTTYWSFGTNATGKVEFYYYNGGGARLTSTASVPLSSWNHISMVYTNSTGNITLYLNGTSVASGTKSGTPQSSGSSTLNLGVAQNTYYNGYISNARVIQGTALYTGNFTPPTEPLTAIAGTSLLTCQSNRFVDNSTNNFAITKTGDVKVTAFGPYDQEAYKPAVAGGSAYFDGSGSTQLSIGSLQNSWNQTGDWTMEFWIYTKPSSNGWIFRQSAISGTLTLWTYSSNRIRLAIYNGGVIDSTTLNLDSWSHVAVVNNGTTDVITLYVDGVSQGSTSSGSMGNYTTHYLGGTQDGVNSPIGYISDFRIVNSQIYTANFTPPTAPLTAVADTSLLLKCTNSNIVDYSGNNNLAVIGNTAVNTTTTKYAAGSVYFDGTGDYLLAPTNQDLVFGTGDFTVEFWLYLTANAGSYSKFFGTGNAGGCFTIETQSTTNLICITDYAASVFITSSTAITLNNWIHIAVARSGTTLKLFQNGTQTGSVTNSTNFVGTIATVGGNGASYINGYIEDVRVTKGLARYTANFTPPTSELRG